MSEQTQNKEEKTETITPDGKNGKKKRAAVILVVLLMVGFILGLMLWVKSKTHIKTDNAFVDAHIFTISSRVSGNVLRVMVQDNQHVKKGDLLVELDDRDYRSRVQNVSAQLDVARNETASTYAQVDAAKAAVNSDRAKLEQAELTCSGSGLIRKR
jgi:membrane fusion protein (multidrug efflux system)